jgi:acetyltransferase-like isoleucine patch superfamily enzyme
VKTGPLDYMLCGLCITLLLAASAGTTWVLHLVSPLRSGPYQVLLDLAVFLLAYGSGTALLLAAIRRIRPVPVGEFSMDSRVFTYWKLTAVLTDLAHKALRPYTTVFTRPLVLAAFGARVGRQAAFGGDVEDLPLVRFGERCTVGHGSVITAHLMTHDRIVLAPVSIGAHAVVGVHSVVLPGVSLGDHAVLAPNSVAATGTRIPAGELWGGNPARRLRDPSTEDVEEPGVTRPRS